jgi:hypothetical protein
MKTGGGGDYNETVVRAQKLNQYFQLLYKHSRDISRYIYTVEPLITDTLINEHLQ